MRRLATLTTVLLLASLLTHAGDERKKRVAVLDFDYGTVRSESAALFGTDVDVGKGISDLLVKYLVRDGTYSVIERRAMDLVLAEQDFSLSDRADPSAAARLGRMLGVDAIIVGSITQFGRDDQRKTAGGLVVTPVGGGAGGGSKKTDKAVVSVDARLVDIETGEVVATAEGLGESSRSGKSFVAVGLTPGGLGLFGADFSATNFQETVLGEAVKGAVEQMSAGVIAAHTRIRARRPALEGLVAYADEIRVILNIGSSAGVRVGDQIAIERVTKEINDPESGDVIHRLTERVGVVEVVKVEARATVCQIVTGEGFSVGDLARTAAP